MTCRSTLAHPTNDLPCQSPCAARGCEGGREGAREGAREGCGKPEAQ